MQPSKRHIQGLILLLCLLGTTLFFYRHFVLDVPWTDTETVNSWTVEAHFRFTAERNTPVKASFIIPYLPPYFVILDEYFVSPHYGVITNVTGYNRQTVWSLRRGKGEQSLYYRAVFHETNNYESALSKPPQIKVLDLPEQQKTAVRTISEKVRQTSADIQTFVQGTIKALQKNDGNAKALLQGALTGENIINAALLVLNQAKIVGMPVKGIYLGSHSKPEFTLLLAAFNGKGWFYVNPLTGNAGFPKNFLIWQYGTDPLFSLVGGKKPLFHLQVSPTPMNALSVAKARGSLTDSQMLRFSLLQLPIRVQDTYKVLLTVPIGAFIILLLRNFIGLKTFGTFMPVLIALAFRETRVIWGTVLFTLIVSLGLLVRFYLEKLRLLLVPRLASILTIVILLMIIISVVSQNLGLDTALSVALFPMVILTMTIERMCILWEERGGPEAILSGLGSLFAAILAFFVMNYAPLQYLLFAFPELLLVLLGIILWCGQYHGYRLSELFRFQVLAKE